MYFQHDWSRPGPSPRGQRVACYDSPSAWRRLAIIWCEIQHQQLPHSFCLHWQPRSRPVTWNRICRVFRFVTFKPSFLSAVTTLWHNLSSWMEGMFLFFHFSPRPRVIFENTCNVSLPVPVIHLSYSPSWLSQPIHLLWARFIIWISALADRCCTRSDLINIVWIFWRKKRSKTSKGPIVVKHGGAITWGINTCICHRILWLGGKVLKSTSLTMSYS